MTEHVPIPPGLDGPPPDLEPPDGGFRLTVLGRAGSYPAPGEATSGYLLSSGETHLLIDCGAGVLSNLLRVLAPQRLSAVLITHLHPDHISDLVALPHLIEFGIWRRLPQPRPLPLYLPAEPAEHLARIPPDETLERRNYRVQDRLQLGPLEIRFAPARHVIPTHAVRVEAEGRSFAFTADTGPAPEVTRLAAGADLLLAEATMPEAWLEGALEVGHLTPRLAVELAREAGARRLLLTHLPMGFPPARALEEARGAGADESVTVAEPLRTHPIG